MSSGNYIPNICRIFKLKGEFCARCRSKDVSPVPDLPCVVTKDKKLCTHIHSVQASTLKVVQSVNEGRKFSVLKEACVYMLSSSGFLSVSSESQEPSNDDRMEPSKFGFEVQDQWYSTTFGVGRLRWDSEKIMISHISKTVILWICVRPFLTCDYVNCGFRFSSIRTP